jgi:enterochelin esterase family protein
MKPSTYPMTVKLFAAVCSLAGVCAMAQPAASVTPASTNVPGAAFPALDAENRATFQLRAAAAQKVQVQLPQGRYDLAKNAEGVWSVTTPALEPGFHYYTFSIDGVSVNDPGSHAFYGTSKDSSGIDVPEPGVDFYTVKEVPHGDIRSKWYFSKVTNSWRRLNVYTPPGYDQNSSAKYPVLYLQHGGGEDETGWAAQGKTDLILDNLIAAGKARSMLIVIANGNLPAAGGARGGGGYSRAGMAPFGNELLNNIVPFIEANFRVQPGSENRALAGLSMGGGQAFYVGLEHKEKFGAIGVFSSGLFGGLAGRGGAAPAVFNAEEQMPGLTTNSKAFNDQLKLFYLSVGEQDPRIEPTKKAVADFKAHGLKVEFASFPGGHEWQVWRKSLHDFAPRLFRP